MINGFGKGIIDESQQKQLEEKLIQHGVPHFSIL